MTMTVGELFAGIGGFGLAAERVGLRVAWHSEIDPYASAVLRKHFPTTPNYGDIREMRGADVEPVDIVTAGPPCQPVSLAGKGLGADDERWLWPDTLRLIGELGPRYVVLENPPALINRGLGDILGALSESGYDAEWQVISAAAVGAWHLRERVWIVAYPAGARTGHVSEGLPARQSQFGEDVRVFTDVESIRRRAWGARGSVDGCSGESKSERSLSLANPSGTRFQDGVREESGEVWDEAWRPQFERRSGCDDWRDQWSTEPDVVRMVHGVPHAVDRIRGLGNAIVPQIAEWIFQRILDDERSIA